MNQQEIPFESIIIDQESENIQKSTDEENPNPDYLKNNVSGFMSSAQISSSNSQNIIQISPSASNINNQINNSSNILNGTNSKEKEVINKFQVQREKKLKQIKVDLVDLGFSDIKVKEALQKTNYCSESAFDILYDQEKNKIEEQKNMNSNDINFDEIYNNYNKEDKNFIDDMIEKYKITLSEAVDAFESCEKIPNMTDQLLGLLK